MAIPQILQQLNRNVSPQLTQIKQATQMLKSAGNPQAMLNQMLARNPQAAQIVRQYGNPKDAFYALAKQKGIDPEEILSVLR